MHIPLPFYETTATSAVSTSELPMEVVKSLLVEVFDRCRSVDEGAVADYIPVLGRRRSVALRGEHRRRRRSRRLDRGRLVPILAAEHLEGVRLRPGVRAIGHEEAHRQLGVNATGLAFNSVMAIELNEERTMNPMVNAGAMATTSLMPGATFEDRWEFIREGLSRFAGRPLDLDPEVYASESATNLRNQGIAHLLQSYGRLYADPDETTDLYSRQCSVLVSATDLAVMGATLAGVGSPAHRGTGHRGVPLQARSRRHGHRRPVRALRRLALRGRAPRQERGQRRDRHHLTRQGRPGNVLFPARRGG